jgi:hypothetical protein
MKILEAKNDEEIREAEENAELQKMENNGRVAGTGGFKFRKAFYNQNVLVVTGLTDSPTMNQIARDILSSHCESLKKKCFVIGGESLAHFPDVKITLHNPSASTDPKIIESGKFFSMIFPTKMHPDSQEIRYFLRKGIEKSGNESMIEMNENDLRKMEEGFVKTFGPFLRKLNGEKFASVSEIPKRPESIIVKSLGERSNLVFRIDDFAAMDSGKTRVMPNLSIRIWEHGRNGWHMTKKGVTLSAYNCHFFFATTIGVFLDQVKLVFENFSGSMEEIVSNFENANDETEFEISDIEPFPN